MAKKATRRKSAHRRKKRRMNGDPSLSPAVVSGTRRKKHKVYGKVRKHRRRVKGMGKITGSDGGDMLLGAIGGLALGIGVKILTDKYIPGKDKMIQPAKALIGAVLAIKSKKPILKGAGIGLAVYGAYGSAKEFGVISGMEEFIHGVGADQKDTMLIEMNGVDYNSTKFVNGTSMQQPDVVSGDEMNGDNESVSGNNMPSVVS